MNVTAINTQTKVSWNLFPDDAQALIEGNKNGDDLVIVDLEGKVVEGKLKPSVDTPHHLYLYRFISDIGAVIHTHSPHATMFALLEKPIPVYSTAHADILGVEVPCTPYVDNREDHIGEAIIKYRREGCPAVLMGRHGVFVFDKNPGEALRISVMLEYVARVAKERQPSEMACFSVGSLTRVSRESRRPGTTGGGCEFHQAGRRRVKA